MIGRVIILHIPAVVTLILRRYVNHNMFALIFFSLTRDYDCRGRVSTVFLIKRAHLLIKFEEKKQIPLFKHILTSYSL